MIREIIECSIYIKYNDGRHEWFDTGLRDRISIGGFEISFLDTNLKV
jgi:hypothetical protein|tara:strand:- start:92 stop:232 length:141 start_codon:yes stop_codon:yes gene_type:complete